MQRVDVCEIEFGDDYVYRLHGEPFTGIGFEADEAGRWNCEIEFLDGMKNGPSREWSSDGKLVSEDYYLNNTRHGTQREWSEAGVLISEKDIEYGICVRRRSWSEDGTLLREFNLDESDSQYELLEAIRKAVNPSQ